MILPEEFVSCEGKYIPDFPDYEKSLSDTPSRGLFINTFACKSDVISEISSFITGKIPYGENAFTFEYDKIGNTPLHQAGAIYIQEPSAMAPVLSIPFVPDAPMLDVCASPGGKSLQLYNLCGGRNLLISNEYSSDRVRRLAQNFERCGVINGVITNFDGQDIGNHLPQIFGTVLVDAPCSGEGMFRKEKEAIPNWSRNEVLSCGARQKKILQSASGCVIPGGFLIYSTCTFSKEENEDVISYFLEKNPDFELCAPKKEVIEASVSGYGTGFELCRRFYPHKSIGEGQFLAVMKRKGEIISPSFTGYDTKLSNKSRIIAEDFIKDTLTAFPDMSFSEEKDGIYLVPSMPDIKSGVFLRGVKLGEIRNGRIVPHHSFFKAFGHLFKNSAEISENPTLVAKYLAGEEIPLEAQKGYIAVKYKGYVLGGGKSSQGVIKNYYPKGLRIKA